MNESMILPCPFCGSKAVLEGDEDTWFVYCDDCGADGPIRGTDEDAMADWNRVCLLVSEALEQREGGKEE